MGAWADPEVLIRLLVALTGLLSILLGRRKLKEIRESRRPKERGRHEPFSLEPGPYREKLSLESPDVTEESDTLRPPKKKGPE